LHAISVVVVIFSTLIVNVIFPSLVYEQNFCFQQRPSHPL
jgi:hypothetical protein